MTRQTQSAGGGIRHFKQKQDVIEFALFFFQSVLAGVRGDSGWRKSVKTLCQESEAEMIGLS